MQEPRLSQEWEHCNNPSEETKQTSATAYVGLRTTFSKVVSLAYILVEFFSRRWHLTQRMFTKYDTQIKPFIIIGQISVGMFHFWYVIGLVDTVKHQALFYRKVANQDVTTASQVYTKTNKTKMLYHHYNAYHAYTRIIPCRHLIIQLYRNQA